MKDVKTLFVGTLKTYENEYNECKNAIMNQSYSDFKHFVYENLPNKEAHLKLFNEFLSKKNEFDILVKVDADTVLKDNNVFDVIVSIFNKNPEIKLIQFKLLDFFTNTRIWGLNAYRNNILLKTQDDIWVDHFIDLLHKEVLYIDEVIGYHSPNPSNYQSFHFGFHRQIKNQKNIILEPLLNAYLKTFNKKRSLALVGAIMVKKGYLSKNEDDIYYNKKIEAYFKKFNKKPSLYLFIYIVLNKIIEKIELFFKKFKKKSSLYLFTF